MDKKDLKIIELLQENSRISYTEMARILGVTETTIRKRIADMEKKGIIKKYTIEVNPEKLGYKNVTILGMDVEPKYLLEAAKKLAEIEEAKWVATSTGDHMIMAEIWTKNGEELFNLITKKISKIRGVKDLCPAIIMERIK
ncbi:transcriptional regulator [Aciduliprofundum sp. MAR08-339]|uniref:Lrp/AsnC family transcriptional regulator n=1 Tax=Aciduliprofundum sp. (strain MAR08-339) TaxID=673860 RepID=UPI0002A4825E|nr:transcriptional regulator [Aciduliprofundum sp. MAR08-339]